MCKEITFIIPTHNRKDYLKEAIESICVDNEFSYEIIIINDASTDDTEKYIREIEKKYPIIYIYNGESRFAHGARKQGVNILDSKYVVFMDDDDYYIDRSFISEGIRILNDHASVACVIGSTRDYIDEKVLDKIDLGGEGVIPQKDYINQFGKKYQKPHSTLSAIFRVSGLKKAGILDSKMVNDTCIYLYGISTGEVYLMNKAVAAYRVHSTNISKGSFKKDFIFDCLTTKKEICEYYSENDLIRQKNNWKIENYSSSIFYFISSSKNKIKTGFWALEWMMINNPFIAIRIIIKGIRDKVKE